jgi:uncharacterized protein (DUF2252 family)
VFHNTATVKQLRLGIEIFLNSGGSRLSYIGKDMAEQRDSKDRIEMGKRQRRVLGRAAHCDLRSAERTFDPIELLLVADKARLPQLLPIKYARMSSSPFAFFRGAVSIMAADLARLPNSGLNAQLCGDAHVQNLGSFAAPDGTLVFDLNDFDETIQGPWEWDIKRMATSLILAGREANQSKTTRRSAAEALVKSYCQSMARFAQQPLLEVDRHMVHREAGARPIHSALRQSERINPIDLIDKYTHVRRNGQRKFVNSRPVFWRVTGQTAKDVLSSLKAYRDGLSPERRHLFYLFRPLDVGFKVVGTGSVGLRDYIVLLEGNGHKDPFFLQLKQEVQSAYSQYLPRSPYRNQGQRVAVGQTAMQPVSDVFLGWTAFKGHQYLVRQLSDRKGSIDLRTLRGGGLRSLAVVAGEILARGHARSGDPCMIHGYSGKGTKLVKSIADFASQYADQTEADYARFMTAIKSKKIKIAT